MSMISNLVDLLRHYQNVPEIGYSEVFGINEICKDAADTIEELSAKLQSANMERSEAHYNGRWIACENRLPEENQRVLASFSHGAVTILIYYDKKFHGIYDYTINTILAWQPLPEPYHL